MKIQEEIRNTCFFTLGAALLALGIVLFLAPNKITTGGTAGMAILLNYITGISIGTLMLAINLPLLLGGWKMLGRAFAIRSVAAIFLSSIFVDVFREYLALGQLSHETLLATLYGGIAVGVGIGLMLRGNASAGGTTTIAQLIASKTSIKQGQVILACDVLIIISAGIAFHDIERSLWSLISIAATAKCIDMMLTGAATEKIVHITSNKVELLGKKIIEQLGPHGTIVSGIGLAQGESKTMIFVTVPSRRIAALKDIIQANDPEAFMVVMDATEMLGRGHGQRP
jgi:uncharacterized membrane-anchored protein YitT (DUF2179 family)